LSALKGAKPADGQVMLLPETPLDEERFEKKAREAFEEFLRLEREG